MKDWEAETLENLRRCCRDLESGISRLCADEIISAMANLAVGTCDFVELIPLLEKVAETDEFYYFDDNGAGGFPRPDLRTKTGFRSWALNSIENIKENSRFEANSPVARALKSNDRDLISAALDFLAESDSADTSLIPILEKIVRQDKVLAYNNYRGWEKDVYLKNPARRAIRKISENNEKGFRAK